MMVKEFNTTGTCIPEMHYMVDISNKIGQIRKLVESGKYFTINRPRQYGKTTVMFLLKKYLQSDYLVVRISFEGIGDSAFASEENFCSRILNIWADGITPINGGYSDYLKEMGRDLKNLDQVSAAITGFIIKANKKVVLMIDEVDKSSDNQLFLNFLGMLRNKYLRRNEGEDYTFHSIILAGVHDVKNLKLKLRPESEKKFNSPWNIAVDFKVDMSFNPEEIATMLEDYSRDKALNMNIGKLSEKLHYYTGGYPYLVSKLCKIIDEEIIPEKTKTANTEDMNKWSLEYVDEAFIMILKENNVNFDDLIKNLENNEDLYRFVERIILAGDEYIYNQYDPVINKGVMYGVLRDDNGKIRIHNRIYEQLIYNYMTSKLATSSQNGRISAYNFKDNFILQDKSLDMERLLIKFQQFMKEEYSARDERFIEREGRLLFLAFIKPVINGLGFDFKEVQISEEKRLDIVITYLSKKYIVELKIWRGEQAHQKGLGQLGEYLDRAGAEKGFLVIYDFRKGKEYKQEKINVEGREIFLITV